MLCSRSSVRPFSRQGFSFVEVLFAILILGVGLIMIAAMFPVAIRQTQATMEETVGRTVAVNGSTYVGAVTTGKNLPSTGGTVKKLPADLWDQVKGNMICSSDRRYAWVALYQRASDTSPTASIFVLALQCRNQPTYSNAYVAEQWSFTASITEGYGARDRITFAGDANALQYFLAPGSSVQLLTTLGDPWPTVQPMAYPYNQSGGSIPNPAVTLGNRIDTYTFELASPQAGPDEYVVVDSGTDAIFGTADDKQFTVKTASAYPPPKYKVYPNYGPLRFTAGTDGGGTSGRNQNKTNVGVMGIQRMLQPWSCYVLPQYAAGTPGTLVIPKIDANGMALAVAGEGAYVIIGDNNWDNTPKNGTMPTGPDAGTVYRLGTRLADLADGSLQFQLQGGVKPISTVLSGQQLSNPTLRANAWIVGKGPRDPAEVAKPVFEGPVQDIYLYQMNLSVEPAAAQAPPPPPPSGGGAMVQVDGSKLPNQWDPNNRGNDTSLRFRPTKAADEGATLVVENLHLFNVTNQKAIYASSSFTTGGQVWTYKQLIFRNLEINDVWRDAIGATYGLHTDFLYVQGADPGYSHKPDVLVQNVYMHDGNAQPLFIKCDGTFGTVVIDGIRTSNVGTCNKVHVTQSSTSIDTVIIQNCPGETFDFGPSTGTGHIGQVIIKNSPGLKYTNPIGTTVIFQ